MVGTVAGSSEGHRWLLHTYAHSLTAPTAPKSCATANAAFAVAAAARSLTPLADPSSPLPPTPSLSEGVGRLPTRQLAPSLSACLQAAADT